MKSKNILVSAVLVLACVVFSGVTVFAAQGRGIGSVRECPVCDNGQCSIECPYYGSVARRGTSRHHYTSVRRGGGTGRVGEAQASGVQNVQPVTGNCPLYTLCSVEGCVQNGPHEHNGTTYCSGVYGSCGGEYCGVQHNTVQNNNNNSRNVHHYENQGNGHNSRGHHR